ncbi:pentapeptide repeat-containing protein [Streptomyces sp. NPDC056402]|uniref:pentapeptide repeat-containing protein n=1 Tax=Streptomyces sp. NPDC056402 TaxID=3345810 RepID=UPI0035D737CD
MPGADASGADASGADASGADASGADASGADASGADGSAAWLAEPSDTERVRRGGRGADSTPASVAAPAGDWVAEPSVTERVRRTGAPSRGVRAAAPAAPAARGVRAGRDGAGGSWPFIGPQSLGSGTPGGSIWRRLGASGSCASPGSLAPGQALATRAARTKSLRSGWPSKFSGRRRGTRCGWSVKVTPNISNVSRSCHSAPA